MKFKEFKGAAYDFITEIMEQPGTKNSPEMVSAISELITALRDKEHAKKESGLSGNDAIEIESNEE